MTQALIRISQGNFNSEKIIQASADALEYIQTREEAFAVLLNEDSYAVSFLEALGNMMKFTANRADDLIRYELTPVDDITS